jgi:pimeloyl-ACP methyl ester carboxylesterase
MPILTLSDGRALEYLENGSDNEAAILLLHGTPGSAVAWQEWISSIQDLKVIAASRAGYGKSSRHHARSVADDLADQAALLDHLGVRRFVAIGWSGGGPHALNMSRDSRNAGVITLAGVGEWGHDDLNFLADMGPENEDEFGEAVKGEAAISDWMERNGPGMANVTGANIIEAFGGLIGDADKAALTIDYAESMAAGMRHALSQGFSGWIDDDLAFIRKFGFDLGSISKPVLIWQGDDDFMVPKAHGEWLAKKIPGAQLNFVPGHGHISLVRHYREQIVAAAQTMLSA